MPANPAMEQAIGIRFTRIAVVGDGGLVEVTYQCLDAEKCSRFQSDVAHPPALGSELRHTKTSTVSLMKQGHQMRAGQTYYFIYHNDQAIEPHELASLTYGGWTLAHIPVL